MEQPWSAKDVQGRKNWGTQRIYEDWSGKSAEERNVLVRQLPPPLNPTARWSKLSNYTPGSICRGQRDCKYAPKTGGATIRGRSLVSGCDNRWKTYANSLFEAFMASNPEVQFGPKAHCLRQIRQPKHRCYGGGGANCIKRGWPLDHDQMCRLPDGQQFIISQPYCGDNLCKVCVENVQSWQNADREIIWRTGGTSRSWYYPTHSNLLVVGYKQTIDNLKLDYTLPHADAPIGCVCWAR